MFTEKHLQYILLTIVVIATSVSIYLYLSNKIRLEGFADYKQDSAYTAQVKLLSDKYSSMANGKRPITHLLQSGAMPDEHQCFVNFYSLGCRFTGYIGPMQNGYFDPDIAVQSAVNAGCRVFVLDIDYMDMCDSDTVKYFPRIVVRDIQGKFMINYDSTQPLCNTSSSSTIRDICEKINFYAFAPSCQNNTDPVVIVLYFLRQPPGTYKSKSVLDYFSNVAKSLSPFSDRLLKNELDGGTFYRQKQEGRLLINKITDYSGKVLIFSNANTNGFREIDTYQPTEDLDFLTNLRLSYSQTKLGITDNKSSSPFGILETAENYMIIPADRSDEMIENTKLRWTMCLSRDPSITVPKETYNAITSKYGIHCSPVILFDDASQYMFTDPLFKTYSFAPKPEPLRYIKPPVITPATPNPSTNANQGMLRAPM